MSRLTSPTNATANTAAATAASATNISTTAGVLPRTIEGAEGPVKFNGLREW